MSPRGAAIATGWRDPLCNAQLVQCGPIRMESLSDHGVAYVAGRSVRNGSARAEPFGDPGPAGRGENDSSLTKGPNLMVTLTPGFRPVSEAPSTDGGSLPSEHAHVCLMSLCATYATHGKLALAAECAWSAFDCARMLRRPDLAFESLSALDAIVSVAWANGVAL